MRLLTTILLLSLLCLNFNPTPVPLSEGYISYSVSVESDQAIASLLGMGSSLELAFKGNFTKAVAKVASTNTVTVIADHQKKAGISLMDIMGEKTAVKLTQEKMDEAKANMNNISDKPMRYTEETKDIAGYTCKRVLMKHKESGANVVLYITDQIKPQNDPFAKLLISEIKGFPLGIVIKKDETTIRIMADKVSSKTPNESAFSLSIPSDYKLTTMDDLKKSTENKIEKNR